MSLLRLMHAEVGDIAPMSERKVRWNINNCLENGAIILACEHDGSEEKIVGTVGLVASEFWFSERQILAERWMFMHPDHRRSRHARNLMDCAIGNAKKVRVPLVMTVFTTKQTEAKNRLFRRHATPMGQMFIAEPEE